MTALEVQEAQEVELLTPQIDICRQRINYPVGVGVTTYLICVNSKGHGEEGPHISHPFKNIFSGETEYIMWRGEDDRSQVQFVTTNFDTFTCSRCHLDNVFHGVRSPCWSCGTMNPVSNYNFGP